MHHFKAFLARRWTILIGLSYLAIGMVSRVYGYHQEDAAWFVHVASRILDGSFDLYSGRAQPWAAPPQGMAFTYPPLMPFILAPFVAIGRAMGLSQRGLEVLVGLPWLVSDVLLASQLAIVTGRWTGRTDRHWRIVTFLLCLLTFIVPFSSAYMGHHESLIALMIVLAISAPDLWRAGLYWGLALALKQTAGFALIPMALLVLRDGWASGPRRIIPRLSAFFLPLIALPAALILPFWLLSPAETSYSIWEVERYRILYGTNLPHLLDRIAGRLMPELQPALNAFLIRWSSPFFLSVISVFSLIIVLRLVRMGHSTSSQVAAWHEPRTRTVMVATMGTNVAAFLVLGKWSETHYQFLALILLLILELLQRPDYPYVYILFVFAGTLFYVFPDPVSSYWRLTLFIALTAYCATQAWRLSTPAATNATDGR